MDPLLEPPAELGAIFAAADEVIALVRGADAGGGRGDTAGLIMVGAYGTGLRRLVSIRELAGRGAGDDAQILLRTLLSLVARAVWVNQPTESEERWARFRRYRRRDLEDGLRMIDQGQTIGIEPDDPGLRQMLADELDALLADGVLGLPNDHDLLLAANMRAFYARIYPQASEHVHFSLSTAVEGLRGNEIVELEAPQWQAAGEALQLALLVFGFLLEQSDRLIGHGLTERVARILDLSADG